MNYALEPVESVWACTFNGALPSTQGESLKWAMGGTRYCWIKLAIWFQNSSAKLGEFVTIGLRLSPSSPASGPAEKEILHPAPSAGTVDDRGCLLTPARSEHEVEFFGFIDITRHSLVWCPINN
jgi:hypothetical protein